MTAKHILGIEKCGDLFPRDLDEAKKEYRQLARLFHPDVSKDPQAAEAMAKINELYTRAQALLECGMWEAGSQAHYLLSSGKTLTIRFLEENTFEFGKLFITSTSVWYVFEAQYEKYFKNMVSRIKGFSFANDKMRAAFEGFLPKFGNSFEGNRGEHIVQLIKTEDMFPLVNVWEYFGEEIPHKHVAWMVSRLSNLCCYLQHSKLSHNGISLANCFISPKNHTIALLGGWWYTVPLGEKMLGTSKQIYDVMPVRVKTDKVGTTISDLESVKLLARQTLGQQDVPAPVQNWANSGSGEKAIDEFAKWDKTLTDAYGPRKFIKLDLSEKDIYNQK